MSFRKYFFVVLLFAAFVSYSPAASRQWLHVHVDGEEQVRVNLPLSLVTTVLPILEEKHLGEHGIQGGKIRLENRELSVQDMRKIWAAVKEEGSFELADIVTTDAHVKVFIDSQYLMVRTEEQEGETVNVQVPVEVVDALLSGEGEELNISAAVDALQRIGNQELVLVESEEAKIRVWVDESNR